MLPSTSTLPTKQITSDLILFQENLTKLLIQKLNPFQTESVSAEGISQIDVAGYSKVPHFLKQIESKDENIVKEGITELRSISSKPNIDISKFIHAGVVAPVLNLLKNVDDSTSSGNEILFQCSWLITNLLSGDQLTSTLVIQQNAIQTILSKIVTLHDPKILNQLLWALGNIAGNSHADKLAIFQCLEFETILKLLISIKVIRKEGHFLVSNLSTLNPSKCPSGLDSIANYCIALFKLEPNLDDLNLWWIVARLLPYNIGKFESIVQIVPFYLSNCSPSLFPVLVRIIGDYAAENDHQVDVLIKSGVFPALKRVLLTKNNSNLLLKSTFFAISNLAAGDKKQATLLVNSGLFADMIKLVGKGQTDLTNTTPLHPFVSDFPCLREFLYCISNILVFENLYPYFTSAVPILPVINSILYQWSCPPDTCVNSIEFLGDSIYSLQLLLGIQPSTTDEDLAIIKSLPLAPLSVFTRIYRKHYGEKSYDMI